MSGARRVHISIDCINLGKKRVYVEVEVDISDAKDLYGKSKHIGELHDENNTINLCTSIIGH